MKLVCMWHKHLRLSFESAKNVQQLINGMQMSQKWIWKILSAIVYFKFIPIVLIPQIGSSVYPT
jgi:hypothetical protein